MNYRFGPSAFRADAGLPQAPASADLSDATQRIVSVVVPSFNEASSLRQHLTDLANYLDSLRPRYAWNMVIVDDASDDGSADVADAFAAERFNIVVARHAENRGLAGALKTGFSRSNGDCIVTIDSDLTYSPDHIGRLLDALQSSGATMALASAYLPGGRVSGVPFVRRTLSLWANRFLSFAARGKVATLTCMVRAYDASRLRRLLPRGHARDFNAEIVFEALAVDAPIAEIPAHLDWSAQSTRRNKRASWQRLLRRALATLRCGFHHRPSLWLAVPGLFPGLAPIVVGAFALAGASVSTIAAAGIVTFAVQLASLAVVARISASSHPFFSAMTARQTPVARPLTPIRSNDL